MHNLWQRAVSGNQSKDLKPSEGLAFTAVTGGYAVSGIGTCTDTDIVVPSLPVTSIYNYAFSNNTTVNSIILPDSIVSIGGNTFSGTHIKRVIIGKGLKTIGYQSFANSTLLESVEIDTACELETIDFRAFYNCTNLSSINLPNTITSMGQGAFHNCSNLGSINISTSLTNIGADLFRSSGLLSISIPDSVTSIGNYAVYENRKITSISIGSGVTSIGAGAFNFCDKAKTLTITAISPPTLASGAIGVGTNPYTAVYVPAQSVNDYKNASGWSEVAGIIQAIPS